MPGPRLHAGFGPTATAVADINHDGKPDILVTDSLSNDVRLLVARGNGFFDDLNPTIFHTGETPGPVFVFNPRPGQTDVVTINAGSNNLTLLPNIGGGGVVVRRASRPAGRSRSRESSSISRAGRPASSSPTTATDTSPFSW